MESRGAAAETGRGRRWVVLGLLLAVSLTSYCVRLLWSNASLQVSADLMMGPAMAGLIVSAFYGGFMISNFGGGFLVDRIGSRASMTGAILSLALFTCAFGLVRHPVQGLACQFMMGLSAGCFFAADAKAIVQWFTPAERGLAFGLLSTPASFGVMLTNLIFPPLLAIWPWGRVYVAAGLATTLLAAAAFVVLRERGPAIQGPPRPGILAGARLAVGDILKSRDMLLMTLAGFCGNWGTWGLVFWGVPLMVTAKGLTPIEAAHVMGLAGLGAAVTKPVFGYLSDVFRERRLFVAGCLVAFTVMLLVFSSLTGVVAFRLTAPLLGFVAFSYSPLIGTMFSERARPERVGSVAGCALALTQIANLLAPAAVGLVYDATGSFALAIVLLACGPACGAGAMLLVRNPDPVKAAIRAS